MVEPGCCGGVAPFDPLQDNLAHFPPRFRSDPGQPEDFNARGLVDARHHRPLDRIVVRTSDLVHAHSDACEHTRLNIAEALDSISALPGARAAAGIEVANATPTRTTPACRSAFR